MKIYDNGIEREATEAEIEYYEAWKKDISNENTARTKAKADAALAKAALLDRLGITADEVALLLG